MKDIGSYQLPEKHPYKLKPEEIPLYDHNSRRRIKKLIGNLNSRAMDFEEIAAEMNKISYGEKYLDPSNDHFIFQINDCETEESNYTQEEMSADFDENNLTMGPNVRKFEPDDVYKFTGKKNIPEVWLNKSCCNISTCVEMAKFLASEKDFSNKVMCEKCKLRVCNSCILANSHLNITEKVKYIRYWNSIKIVRHDSGLRIQSDYFYKNDPKIVFKPENSNFRINTGKVTTVI